MAGCVCVCVCVSLVGQLVPVRSVRAVCPRGSTVEDNMVLVRGGTLRGTRSTYPYICVQAYF